MDPLTIWPHRLSRRLSVVLSALWLCAAMPVGATIFKCQGDNGTPVYQDEPCARGKELRDFDKDPPTVSVMPLGPSPGASTVQTLPKAPPPAKNKNEGKTRKSAVAGNPVERKFLAPGINEGEVITRIGTPDMKSGGNGRKTARWTYLPTPEDPRTVTTLTFEHGRLIEVERKIVK
jgi:Domain of unknown function (DUF4124)